jgi:uncharacterized protein (DUF934 family)
MATLIRNRRVVSDSWRLLSREPSGKSPEIPLSGDVIVPLAMWLEHRESLAAYPDRIGLWLDSHEGPESVSEEVQRFPIIAVNFRTFGDGRGYSTARLLRDRHGFRGELRAIGDVRLDQLDFMEQCGFDAFALRDGHDAREALAAFGTFSDGYQTSILRPVPLFRRRLAGR